MGVAGEGCAQQRPGGPGVGRLRGDRSAVQLAHPSRDGQSEAGAAGRVGSGAEPFEDALGVLGGDARSLVADLEPPGGRVHRPGADQHLTVGRAVPDRVVDEVDHQLGEPGGVAHHGEVLGMGLAAHRDGARADRGLRRGCLHQVGDAHLGDGQGRHPGVQAGEVEQVGDQRAESLGLPQRPPERLVVGAHDPIDEVLQEGPLGSQRGPQLVRHGCHESTPLLVGGGEVGRHRVEGDSEVADLVGAGRRDPLAVVAAGHRPGGPGHLAQGGGHPAGQPLGDGQCCRDGDGHAGPPRDLGRVADLGDHHGHHDAHGDEQAQLDLDRRDRIQGARSVHAPTSRA